MKKPSSKAPAIANEPKRKKLTYSLKSDDFASRDEMLDFQSALFDLESYGDIAPLLAFLRQRHDSISNIVAEILDGALLGGGDTYIGWDLDAYRLSGGDLPELEQPRGPFTVQVNVKQERNEESIRMKYEDALFEFCQRSRNGEKRSDIIKDVIQSYGLSKPTFLEWIAAYEKEHGALPRDPRGRKPR